MTPLLVVVTTVLLVAGLTWCIGLSGFIYFRDDVIRSLLHRHAITVEQYEDKITSLRLQVDSIRSRQFINQDNFSGVIDDLRLRQETIEAQQAEILGVVERAKQAGVKVEDAEEHTKSSALGANQKVKDVSRHSVTLASRRHIGDAPISRPAIPPREALVFANTPDTSLTRAARQIDEELRSYANRQSDILNGIELETAERSRQLRTVFDSIKLDKKRFGLDRPDAVGGPFIPAKDAGTLSETALQIARIDKNLSIVSSLEATIAALPIRRPVPSRNTVSSSFGTRIDPFLRRRAFHAGVDYRAPTGTKVVSTASGKVVKAGWSGGYGRLVEVRHGNGLSTRYAHLSRIAVKAGDRVRAGQVIGRVGSTGRSTGPHLHYETRIDGKAVNPVRFLNAL